MKGQTIFSIFKRRTEISSKAYPSQQSGNSFSSMFQLEESLTSVRNAKQTNWIPKKNSCSIYSKPRAILKDLEESFKHFILAAYFKFKQKKRSSDKSSWMNFWLLPSKIRWIGKALGRLKSTRYFWAYWIPLRRSLGLDPFPIHTYTSWPWKKRIWDNKKNVKEKVTNRIDNENIIGVKSSLFKVTSRNLSEMESTIVVLTKTH